MSLWKTKCYFFTAYGERQLGPTHKERIDKRRRDPFINRKRGEPQEQVTETQSEGKTRFYPTHSHEVRGQTGKGNTLGEGMAPGNKNWLRMPNRPTERGKSLLLQKENLRWIRNTAMQKLPRSTAARSQQNAANTKRWENKFPESISRLGSLQ